MDWGKTVAKLFVHRYGLRPLLVRSPARINLLGEHTDYNQGFVLPAAIDKTVFFALAPRKDGLFRFYAANFEEEAVFSLNGLKRSDRSWLNHVQGVLDQFLRLGHTPAGLDCVFGGDIPIGAGLSSSAAVEAGLAFALDQMNGWELDRLTLARLAKGAEHDFVGVSCGIMDPYINLFGLRGHVLRIDCRSLEHLPLPFDDRDFGLVLFNSRVSHSLAASEYNRRRAQCEEGVAIIRRRYPEVDSLRDVAPEMLDGCRDGLNETVYRRCRYVVEENSRMEKALPLIRNNDREGFGRLMTQTHYGLKTDYEVSCPELDFMVDALALDADVLGSRMMGGGFGGCTINLIRRRAIERVTETLLSQYRSRFGIDADCIVTTITAGTEQLEESS